MAESISEPAAPFFDTQRLAADLARIAVDIEDAPAEAFQDPAVYVPAGRIQDLLDPVLDGARRHRQMGDPCP